ncbi:MAG TPA: hypothetical protein VGM62_07925 [Chthoniobacterales bacterium]|jgi:hypothetical protein
MGANANKHRWVASLAAVAFAWTLALSAAPALHARLHAGEDQSDHSCAVTFVRSGSYDHSPTSMSDYLGNFVPRFAFVTELSPQWVASPFLTASVFEHGPPFFS